MISFLKLTNGVPKTFEESETLQDVYEHSTTPEITTNATNGALSVKRGSAADTDNVIEGKNAAGTTTFSVDGNGKTTATSFVGPATALKSATTSIDTATATSPSNGQVLTATDSTHATWQTPVASTLTKGKVMAIVNFTQFI
jgi:hypothetical protein